MAIMSSKPHGLLRGNLVEAIYRIDDAPTPKGPGPDRNVSRAIGVARSAPALDRGLILRKAEEYRSRGRIRKAIREFERILAVDPQDVETHAKVAPLYIRIARKDKAKASIRRVVAAYEKQGFVDRAIAMLRLGLRLDCRDLGARLHLADLYVSKNMPGNAVKLLERARRAFRGKRYLKEALSVEGKLLGIAPDDFRAQVSMVRLLCKAGRDDEGRARLWQMEAQWAKKGNGRNWRKTRLLLSCYAPSLATSWGYLVSLLASPVPYGCTKRGGVPS